MSLVKHTPEQEIKMLEKQIKKIEDKDIKGFIARMARHYEVKKLRNKIKNRGGKRTIKGKEKKKTRKGKRTRKLNRYKNSICIFFCCKKNIFILDFFEFRIFFIV